MIVEHKLTVVHPDGRCITHQYMQPSSDKKIDVRLCSPDIGFVAMRCWSECEVGM